jgi:hypothetical protein
MKISIASIVCSTLIAAALAIGVISSAPFAFAASAETISTVNVPFSFWMDNHELPAGAYRILLRSNKMLQLNGPDGQIHMIMGHTAISPTPPRTGYVLFHRYGETSFLAQVWSGETNIGVECSRTPAEKRAERQMVLASKRSTAGLPQIALNSQNSY